ncbi:ECF transporter S component [Salinibacterium sp. G-O1]|uniref:ECF transporter S component n=1 Tax=Salinibacterium sp. G-O1 TaxID=3046208 RepID=UPI0024BBC21E|nr:ECF transporter S component [Salinibacterium sp. G-O1]MDJ0333849.1 ECF transporter S component [Salinibacterium sp. G-O1]
MNAIRQRWSSWSLVVASAAAAAGFAWPLVASALPTDARAAAPAVALAVVPALAVAVALTLDRQSYTAKTVALLGVLAAVGAAIRIAGTGVGGVEAVFILLILAGRAYGARFGFLLGMLTIALSSVLWGGFGPWTPFQLFACGWVGAGAGLLPRVTLGAPRTAARLEILMLVAYGVAASYAFGLVMNLWFWPFAVGSGTGISYQAGAPLGENLASFGLYSLATSTLTWDTVRAITTAVGIVLVGPATLAALRRAKLGHAHVTPRSTAPRGDGTRTHQSTARDEAAAPQTEPRPSARA